MGDNRSLDHIRAQAGNWTLQGDADLLDTLVKISKDVVERAEASSKKVDDLCISLNKADCDLQIATNSFTALANQQFMENRVAEEEPVIAVEEKKIEPEINAAERNKRVREEVLRNSLAFLDEIFDVIEVPKTIGPNEEPSKTKLTYQMKNPTLGIKIPYVIGTKEFEEDEFIGLGPPAKSEPKPTSQPVEVNWGNSSLEPSISSEEDGQSASVGTQQSNHSSQRSSFMNELSAAVGGESPTGEVGVTQPKIRSLMSAYDQREPPSLFGGNEDDEEANDTIFGSGANLFKGDQLADKSKFASDEESKSLFADDEDNLFNEAPPQPKQMAPNNEKPASKPAIKLPAGAVSIFGNNKPMLPKQRQSSTSSKSSADEPAQSPIFSTSIIAPVPEKPKRGLFDDDSDDDLFAAPPTSKEKPGQKTLKDNYSNSSLFGDSIEEDFDSKQSKPQEPIVNKPITKATENKSINPQSSSAAVSAPKSVAIIPKKLSLFGDSDSDEDIFASTKSPVTSKGLFGDETEDLFKPSVLTPKTSQSDIFATSKASGASSVANLEKEESKEVKITSTKQKEASVTTVLPSKPKIEDKPAPQTISANRAEEKKRLTLDLPIKTPKVVNLFESPETEEESQPQDMLTNSEEQTEKKVTQETKTPIVTKAPAQSVVRRGLALNINPLALLPGSKPLKTPTPLSPSTPPLSITKEPQPIITPSKEEIITPPSENTSATEVDATVDTVSFDDAPKNNSKLLHPGKDRIRIKQKRKPPSRKGRPASTESPSEPSTSNLVSPVSPATDEDDLFVVPPVQSVEEKVAPPSLKEEAPFREPELSPSSIFTEPPPLPSKMDDIFGDEDDYLFSDPLPVTNDAKVDVLFSFEPPPLPNEKVDTPSDDLFAKVPVSEEKISNSNSALKSQSIDELFAPAEINPPDLPVTFGAQASTSTPQQVQSVVTAKDIFGGDNDDDDLFGPLESTEKVYVSNAQGAKIEQSPPIFDEPQNRNTLDSSQQFGANTTYDIPEKHQNESDVSPSDIFRAEPPPLEAKIEATDDIFREDDIFSDALSPNSSADLLFDTPQSPKDELFGYSADKADVFLTPDSSMETPKTVETHEQPQTTQITKLKNEPASLFGENDDDEDDDLFGAPIKNISAAKPVLEKEQKKPVIQKEKSLLATPTPKTVQGKPKVHDIFAEEEDDDDDLFGTSVQSTVVKQPENSHVQPKKVAMSADLPANESPKELFGSSSKSTIVEKKKEMIKKKSSALFGDLDDEENDLFGSSVKSKAPPKQQTLPKSQEKRKSEEIFDDPLLGGQ